MPLDDDQKKEFERRVHRSAAFQRAFHGPDGDLTLKEIDKFCGYKNDTFDADPYGHAYNAGRRSAAIFIHNVLEADLEEARKILNAQNQEGGKPE